KNLLVAGFSVPGATRTCKWRNAQFKVVGRFSFLLTVQRAAGAGATCSAFVLGRFNLLALAQRAASP
ncbi:hypothetical protein A2U01_0119538, partial [Trifolium medium]|nr:hypothetical protein [Trifolium medium]